MSATNPNHPEGSSPRTTRAAKKAQDDSQQGFEVRIDQKIARLEQAMEAMAASVSVLAKKKAKKRKNKEAEETIAPPPKKPKKAKKSKKANGQPPSTSAPSQLDPEEPGNTNIPTQPQHTSTDISSSIHHVPGPAPATRPTTFPDPKDVTSRNQVSAPLVDVADVNKNKDWTTWLLDSAGMLPAKPASIAELPVAASLQAQVNNIVENTPTLLSKCTSKVKNYPYEYVRRGNEKRPTAMNTLALAEHIWGIFAMIHDPAFNDKYKPALLRHIEEIVEDCRDYEWVSAVRPWSEEIFSLVAENRLPNGWLDTGRIQLLRMSISRTSTAKFSAQKEYKGRSHSASYQNADHSKGALPCLPYNSTEGCSLPSGHTIAGRRMQHVCANCFHATGATYPHPEVNCRNKTRQRSHHF